MKRGELIWKLDVRPSPFGRLYKVRIRYRSADSPEVVVVSPDLNELADGRHPPHVLDETGAAVSLRSANRGVVASALDCRHDRAVDLRVVVLLRRVARERRVEGRQAPSGGTRCVPNGESSHSMAEESKASSRRRSSMLSRPQPESGSRTTLTWSPVRRPGHHRAGAWSRSIRARHRRVLRSGRAAHLRSGRNRSAPTALRSGVRPCCASGDAEPTARVAEVRAGRPSCCADGGVRIEDARRAGSAS